MNGEIGLLANFDLLVLFGDVARDSFVRFGRMAQVQSRVNGWSLGADLAVEGIRCGLEALVEAFGRSEIGVDEESVGGRLGRDFRSERKV